MRPTKGRQEEQGLEPSRKQAPLQGAHDTLHSRPTCGNPRGGDSLDTHLLTGDRFHKPWSSHVQKYHVTFTTILMRQF